jgi:hypothetical protein
MVANDDLPSPDIEEVCGLQTRSDEAIRLAEVPVPGSVEQKGYAGM